MNQDSEHLRLLSIFHYVLAGITACCSLLPVIHLAIGIGMLSGSFEQKEGPDPRWIGLLFVIFACLFILCALTFSILVALSGRYLARRQRYTFCLVMACIACAFMPFGTILGVFTIMILNRESVKQSFGQPTSTGSGLSAAT